MHSSSERRREQRVRTKPYSGLLGLRPYSHILVPVLVEDHRNVPLAGHKHPDHTGKDRHQAGSHKVVAVVVVAVKMAAAEGEEETKTPGSSLRGRRSRTFAERQHPRHRRRHSKVSGRARKARASFPSLRNSWDGRRLAVLDHDGPIHVVPFR